MPLKLWDEGVSWFCLPHAVIALIGTGATAINEWWVCGVAGTLISGLFFMHRKGCIGNWSIAGLGLLLVG